MTRFDGLIRLRKWQLDGERRKLAELEQHRADIHAGIEQLQRDLMAEQEVASVSESAGYTYGGFAQAVIARREELFTRLADANQAVEAQHQVVREAFEELKRYEIAAERARERAEAERDRAEEIEDNEIALQQHRRNKAM